MSESAIIHRERVRALQIIGELVHPTTIAVSQEKEQGEKGGEWDWPGKKEEEEEEAKKK